MKALETQSIDRADQPRQRILDEIADIKREMQTRQSFERRTPASVIRAYHALLDRHFQALDALNDDAR